MDLDDEVKGLHNLPHGSPTCHLSPSHKTNPPFNLLNMQQQPAGGGVVGVHQHFIPYSNPSQDPDFCSFFHSRWIAANSQMIQVSAAGHGHGFSSNTSSLSNESTPGPGESNHDHYQLSILNERRLRRMISNRESARRSRMRKKKQIEDLQSQVDQLQAANHQLSERLIHLFECNHQILQENVQLKEKISSLQIILSNVLTVTPLRGLEEVHQNTNRFKPAEASNPAITRSMDLLL